MSTTVDEFGRVIPAAAPLSSSRGGPRGRSQSPPPGRYGGSAGVPGAGAAAGGRGGRGRSRSRHHHSRDRGDPRDRDSGGGRDHHSSSHHHPRDSRDRDRDHNHHGGDRREWRKRPRSPSSGPPQSLSQQGFSSSSGPRGSSTSRLRHPSHRYVEEPMLCQFVWKSQQQDGSSNKDSNKEKNDDQEPTASSTSTTLVDVVKKDEQVNSVTGDAAGTDDDDDKKGEQGGKESYDEYRKRFCLNYVRSFFNTHMDDFWFRNRYSPLGKKREIMKERERSKHEAQVFQSQMEASLQQHSSSTNTTERCSFVQQARLGGGVKTSSSTGEEASVPSTHALSIASPDNILHITDVPPHVTDEQLTLALMDHCMIPAGDGQVEGSPVPAGCGGIQMVSGSVTADRFKNPLWRDAFLICSATVKQDIITHLSKAEDDHGDAAAKDDKGDSKADEPAVVVPRKDKEREGKIRAILPLDVECSDPYGRLDVDDDGKGGAPEDGVGVPPRKSTVWVSTQYRPPAVPVLSAAISSKERLGQDKDAATMMARALDAAKNIPTDQRLDEVLDSLFGADQKSDEVDDASLVEDTLDVAVAYLRRVHLFSFYNGCASATNVADVLSGKHAAGTIHLRLSNADEILAEDSSPIKTDDDASAPAAPKDLLVSRLDASIEKALAECNEWIISGGDTIVSEREDQEAAKLEQSEAEWKATWLDNHAVIDDDGRARCSFHFCHKLFKDTTFLRKHLQKKHKEFLRAEQAQLHDEYMMKAWDAEDKRPVPAILVDCGANFDLVPSSVVGAEPMSVDPEPELWRKEEERRKHEEEMQQERQEQRRQIREHRPDQQQHHQQHPPLQGGGEDRRPPLPHRERPVNNFVDVDDMKEEKVEMAFDNIDVPVQPPKKKKKKKRLL